MSTDSLSSIAEDYFYNLNSLARRIGDDVEATKDAYEGLWNTLSMSEKNQAIDETIIQPEVALKYTIPCVNSSSKDPPEWYPKLRIQTGLKHVIDETGSTLRWRDEHSGPFSFMTQSQMNLSLLGYSDNPKPKGSGNYDDGSPHFASPMKMEESSFECSLNEYSPSSNQTSFYQSESYSDSVFKNSDSNRLNSCTNNDNSGNIFTKLMNKTSILKSTSPNDDMESLVPQKNTVRSINMITSGGNNRNSTNINSTNSKPKFSEINESTALLDSSSSYSSFQSSQTNRDDDGIPKTGFEFLDNW